MSYRLLVCVALGASLVAPSRVRAQWTEDPAVNTPVAIGPGRQYAPGGIPDGAGGAFIVWADTRDSAATGVDLWAQHISEDGVRLWGDSGVPVALISNDQIATSLLATADGGVLVSWNTDPTYPAPRVQRLDANGSPLWGASGVAVTAMTGQHLNPRLLAASSGDVFVSWSTSENMSVMAQRLDPDGQRLWGDDGVIVCTSSIPQAQRMVPDGAGGMILGWQDFRDVTFGNVYAQRLDANGSPQWTPNGARVAPVDFEQGLLRCLEDGAGGMLLTWQDNRSGESHVYAQRVGPDGAPLWNPTGVEASTNSAPQTSPRLVDNITSDVLVGWTDASSGQGAIFVQQWSAAGQRQWGDEGFPAGSVAAAQMLGSPAPDESAGIIVGWSEVRSGAHEDIFAQRVRTTVVYGATEAPGGLREDGLPPPEKLWGVNGVVVSSATGRQSGGGTLSDGVGGAVLFWHDRRSDGGDIYAQHVRPNGTLGTRVVSVETQAASPHFALSLAGPQPCRSEARLRLDQPADGDVRLMVLDLQGRRVRSLVRGAVAAGAHPVRWDLRDDNGSRVAPGVYLASASGPGKRAHQRIVVLP